MKIIAGVLGGLIVAILAALLVTTTFAAGDPNQGGTLGAWAFFIAWATCIGVAIMAPRAAKAWRRLLVTSAAFLLPIAGIIFTGSAVATSAATGNEYAAAEAAGAALGGSIVAGFLGFAGFFLGVVFLVIGLLVGRDKQVVYMQAPPITPT